MWVLSHPNVRGNSTRIAVYAGLRAVAWESPDTYWRSTREIARAVSDVVGVGEEACRKHLRALVKEVGAIVITDDEVIVPDDEPPTLGTDVGTQVPNVGSVGTQSDQLLLLPTETVENPTVGTTGVSKADLNVEHPKFATFWHAYPRKKDRPKATRSFNKAMAYMNGRDDLIMAGLEREKAGWKESRRPLSKIQYPATWLNRHGWMNDADRSDGAATEADRRAQAESGQRGDIQHAIDSERFKDAWDMLIEKASVTPGTQWWKQADESIAEGLTDSLIGRLTNATPEAVTELRRIRQAALHGEWELSPLVRQLSS
jgi:hypothetical protein